MFVTRKNSSPLPILTSIHSKKKPTAHPWKMGVGNQAFDLFGFFQIICSFQWAKDVGNKLLWVYMGVSENGGTPISHPKSWSFLGKTPWLLGKPIRERYDFCLYYTNSLGARAPSMSSPFKVQVPRFLFELQKPKEERMEVWKKWLPSRELTYPLESPFWRWFSFSPGGIY